MIAQGETSKVLANPNALAQTQLQPPLLVRLSTALRDRGLLERDAPLPRDEAQLLAMLTPPGAPVD